MPIRSFIIAILSFSFGFFVGGLTYAYAVRRMETKSEKKAEFFCFCLVNAMFCTLFGVKFSADITHLFPCAVAITLLSTISLCDEKNGYLPDELLLLFFLTGVSEASGGAFAENLIACLSCGVFFLLLYAVSCCVLGSDGIGRGDVALTACAGLFLGGSVVMALSFGVVFAACGMILRALFSSPSDAYALPLSKPEKEPYFPLAPSLTAGVFLTAFFGADITAALFAPFAGMV